MLDEIPVGGGGGMGEKGEFDELPIGGNKNTFDISEFPEGGEQAQVETTYTMEQKLKSKAVKLRLSGM